jgi:demethoxyubiquinone hydroxylase (CLK1/Coq7/Cat5 family)
MITKETAVKIWHCYNEIESAEKILTDLAESLKKSPDEAPTLSNAFGERCGLQLGVPSGNAGQRIFGVNTEMGVKVIEQHIQDKKKRLEEFRAIAHLEMKQV